eukprot:m.444324 g.444324  ORF g.444324 m.444324 type:complete len:193 (-) comp20296_c11_seq14:47-625(-)
MEGFERTGLFPLDPEKVITNNEALLPLASPRETRGHHREQQRRFVKRVRDCTDEYYSNPSSESLALTVHKLRDVTNTAPLSPKEAALQVAREQKKALATRDEPSKVKRTMRKRAREQQQGQGQAIGLLLAPGQSVVCPALPPPAAASAAGPAAAPASATRHEPTARRSISLQCSNEQPEQPDEQFRFVRNVR